MEFIEVLSNPEGRELVDMIEELHGETDPELVRIRSEYIKELKSKYGYNYIV